MIGSMIKKRLNDMCELVKYGDNKLICELMICVDMYIFVDRSLRVYTWVLANPASVSRRESDIS